MTLCSRATEAATRLLRATASSAAPAALARSNTTARFLPKRSLAALFVAATTTSARALSSAGRRHFALLPAASPSIFASVRGGGSGAASSSSPSLSPFSRRIQRHGSAVVEADRSMSTDAASVASTAAAGAKLAALRTKMAECGVDVYLVPSDDPHLSEYVPAAYMRRGYLTDFHGSAGTAVVTRDNAYLWTDSRYFNEAALRLDPAHWDLMRQGRPGVPALPAFLADLAAARVGASSAGPLRVGLDAFVHAASFARELAEACGPAAELDTLDGRPNLVDAIWAGRPALPKNPFRVHPMQYAGVTVADKVRTIRAAMTDKKATLAVFSALDDVAYLFNLRCTGDIATCPVGLAYATVSHEAVTLYCDAEKAAPAAVAAHLREAGATVAPYAAVVGAVEAHLAADTGHRVWLDGARSSHALARVVPPARRVDAQSPVVALKAVKNAAELAGARRAHAVDGAAMAEFMAWLRCAVAEEGRRVSEVEIDRVLTGFRAQRPGFREVSFPTIAGVGANGAIVHYQAAEGSPLLKELDTTTPILIDSGGQYDYGTTDVTRTWYFGEDAGAEFRDVYTRVLKGNIAVDTAVFPENTPGFVLDALARKSLWEVGKDYGHGTGHGVGAALNVHEGPHSISPRWANQEVLKRGMITSNEPGYYDDGRFGIRIENLLEIVAFGEDDNDDNLALGANREGPPPAKKPKSEGKQFLRFAKLTMIPIQKNLIDLSLMTEAELDWLDAYHEDVLATVAPLLEEGTPAMEWLRTSCENIERT